MKKLVWILVLIVLVVAGIFVWQKFSKVPIYHVNEILTPSTVILLDVPDVSLSRARFSQTALSKMLKEPTVSSLVGQIRASSAKMPDDEKIWFSVYQQFAGLLSYAEGELFLAVTDFQISPKFAVTGLIGWDDHSHTREVNKAVNDLIAKLRIEFPSSQLEDRTFEKTKYQVWTNQSVNVAFGRLGNLFLISYGEKPLQDAILRASNSNESELKDAAPYKIHDAKLAGSDLTIFLNPEKFASVVSLLRSFSHVPATPDYKLPIESFLMTVAFKGESIEDHSWVRVPSNSREEMGLNDVQKCDRATLKAVGKDSLFYFAMAVDFPKWLSQTVHKLKGIQSGKADDPLEQINNLLAYQKIDVRNDLVNQLGPEFGASLEWGANDVVPAVNVAAQVQDPEKVRVCMDQLIQFASTLYGTTSEKIAGPGSSSITTIHFNGPGSNFISPSIAIMDKFLFASVSSKGIEQMLKTYIGEGEALANKPEFKSVEEKCGADYYQFIYVDQKQLFERVYNLANGVMGMAAPYIAQRHPGLNINLTHLPPTREFTDHLSNSVSVAKATPQGFETSSYGSMSLPVLVFELLFPEVLETKK